jgi:hypothetical protein
MKFARPVTDLGGLFFLAACVCYRIPEDLGGNDTQPPWSDILLPVLKGLTA